MNLKSAKIYLDSSKVYLNLRKRMIKLWNSDVNLLKFRQISVTTLYYLISFERNVLIFNENKIKILIVYYM